MKKYFVFLLVISLLMGFVSPSLASNDINVYIDNQLLHLTDSPIIQDGRTLVPMRSFFEALGATVDWESETQTAVGTRGGVTVRIPIGSENPTINNQVKSIQVVAQIIGDRTYIPLRFVGEALGDEVNWDKATRTINIFRAGCAMNDEPKLIANDAAPNLIPNASVEISQQNNPNRPDTWTVGSWGNNTATFTYLNEGYSGHRSMKIEVANYVDGDAKWYFEPVELTPGADYLYSDYYRSDVESKVILAIHTNKGTIENKYLPSAPASAEWKEYKATFTIPAHAKSVTVYHLLSQNGYLITDDYAIKAHNFEGFNRGIVSITFDDDPWTDAQVVIPIMKEFGFTSNHFYLTKYIENPRVQKPINIPNSSVEISQQNNPNMPDGWSVGSWGDNTVTFTYLNEGYSGHRSMKIEVVNYVDGDAKWYFEPVELTPGANYVFSDYYRSDVESKVFLAIHTNKDTIEYINLPNAPASNDWKGYKASFTMPVHAKSVTVYHVLNKNGYLITDDYVIHPDINPKEAIQRFIDAGHEIGSHSVSHSDFTKLTPEQVTDELIESKLFLEDYLGVPIKYFAAPYGLYNASVKAEIMKHYSAHRTINVGYNSKDNFDITQLRVQNVLNTTTPEQVAAWVEKAKADKVWLILVYHRVVSNPGLYDTNPELFQKQMQVISAANVPVFTISKALAELCPQL